MGVKKLFCILALTLPAPAFAQGASSKEEGRKLYQFYCSACHGLQGQGDGYIAPFLDPKPRDFTRARFRIASTENGVPTDEDLRRTIERGMPGSWMPSYAHLPERERQALVEHLRWIVAEGEGGRTKPGKLIVVPTEPRPTDVGLERGRRLYLRNCASCHGADGRGGNLEKLRDDLGHAIAARDLNKGIFKGSSDPVSLYRRIYGGVPGTPMPSYAPLGEKSIWDIVHYVRTIPMPGSEEKTLPLRREIGAYRVPKLPEMPSDPVWDAARPVYLALMPMWWQDLRVEGVVARALHDGKEVAIQMSWIDTTPNDTAYWFPELSDGAGIEISSGTEPLIGMGSENDPVNLWFWRANWERDRRGFSTAEVFYPGTLWTPYPWANQARFPTEDVLPPRPPGPRGPVKTQAAWLDPGWAVVFRRAIAAPGKLDVPLKEGGRASVAFTVWDAAEGERRGQISVSVWHDLVIKP